MMIKVDTQDYLNNFFSKYIENPFIIFSHSGKPLWYSIDIRLFCLKHELVSQYSFSELKDYILEILVILLKDDYDLDYINAWFFENFNDVNYTAVHNLGKFAGTPIYKKVMKL